MNIWRAEERRRDLRSALPIQTWAHQAAIATQALRSMLFGVAPFDLLTFSVVTMTLVAVGMLAAYVPARRASRVDPNLLLRGG